MNSEDNSSNPYNLITNITNDDIQKCRQKSTNDKVSEIYRKQKPYEGIKFTIEDFVSLNLKGYTKQTIKAKTYCYYNKDIVTRAIVFIVHGLGGSSLNVSYAAKCLAEEGFFVCSMDLREHGLTEPDIGYCKNFNDYIDDYIDFVKLSTDYATKAFNKTLPSFIIGFSMGGLITHYVSRQLEFTGVIYAAPCFNTSLNGCLRCLISFVACCNPRQHIPEKEPVYSKNPNVNEDIDSGNFGTVNSLVKKTNFFNSNPIESHEKAFLIIIAGVEKMVCLDTIINYYNYSKVNDKSTWLYPNLWHAVFEEEEVFDLMPRLNKWISDRC